MEPIQHSPAYVNYPFELLKMLSLRPGSLSNGDIDPSNSLQLKPHLGQILRSRRVRVLGSACVIVSLLIYVFYDPAARFKFDYPAVPNFGSETSVSKCADSDIDWSRFAYTQYVTNTEYLCNSVMLFEILYRLGSKADRLMMYPASMHPDPASPSTESQLLLKAEREFKVKLMPIEIQHRPQGDQSATWADSYTKLLAFNQTYYDRVLSLDSDSTILQPMDELFLLPPAPVAMPRAYWLDKPYLSSQLVLIQPSTSEFTRVKDAIDKASSGDFDMEIVNNIYGKDCMIIPHRRYDLLTGEFRSKGKHESYLGNGYEGWDPEKVLKEAKFLHFSDWPVPKPWIEMGESVRNENQPKCEADGKGGEDCRARDLWVGFYTDFQKRRKDVCGFAPKKLKMKRAEIVERGPPREAFIPQR
ncbi:hypothetical protein VTL71DRAFT_11109 [Oculimacula yallundae]|uniref:Uncharacterized protein n=1 Tax=Oculimacula yallundae TaxID=86028 RepID=A0ABR4CVJ2_9HELO